MSWLKIEHDLPDKPEPFQMAGILGIEPDAVVGKLLRVWIWADKHTSIDDAGDGYASVTVLPLLNRIAGVTDFTDAMIKVGWLAIDGDALRFPRLGRHNGKTAKDRALSACRMAEHRARKESGCANVAAPLRSERNNSVTREEKRREEKIVATEQQGAVAPAAGAASPPDTEEPPALALSGTEPPKPKPSVNPMGDTLEQQLEKQAARKAKATRFTPPTEAELGAYAAEIGMEPQQAAQFLDYQTAKGWKVGTSPMKDWRAALRTWQRNGDRFAAPGNGGSSAPALNPKRNGSLPYLQIPTEEEWAADRAKAPPKTPEELAYEAERNAEMARIGAELAAEKAAKEAAKKAKEAGQ